MLYRAAAGAAPRIVLQQAAAKQRSTLRYTQCAGSILRSIESI